MKSYEIEYFVNEMIFNIKILPPTLVFAFYTLCCIRQSIIFVRKDMICLFIEANSQYENITIAMSRWPRQRINVKVIAMHRFAYSCHRIRRCNDVDIDLKR